MNKDPKTTQVFSGQFFSWDTRRQFIGFFLASSLAISCVETWYELASSHPDAPLWSYFTLWPKEWMECLARLSLLLLPLYLFRAFLRRKPFWQRLLVFALLSGLLVGVEETVVDPLGKWLFHETGTPDPKRPLDRISDAFFFFFFLAFLGYTDRLLYRRDEFLTRLFDIENRRLQEETARSLAELKALQNQINPHFLFNSLNSLVALIDADPAKAKALIEDLADLYRIVLGASRKGSWSLHEEMDCIESYLKIEAMRLGDRLRYSILRPEADSDVKIPSLLVQPLVENAVKHGVAPAVGGGWIRVTVEQGTHLTIRVENGPKAGEAFALAEPVTREGTGLENVRRRLDLAYGAEARLRLDRLPDRTCAELTIPLVKRTPS